MKRRTIVLATGGTGGHVFPAEALAAELLGRGRNLVLVTDVRGTTFGGALGRLPVYTVAAGTPTRGTLLTRVRGMMGAARGTVQALRMLDWLQPDAVVGFGSYASLPTVLAASWKRIATVVHEQNAILGRANRFLAPRASAIALTFPATMHLRDIDQTKADIVGNPVRVEMRAVRAAEYVAPQADGPFHLLVIGGSQGASIFATLVPEALGAFPAELRARLHVSQQCRPEDLEAAQGRYRVAGIGAELAPFFNDVPRRMGTAHLVICRAGASTVSELAVTGRPAILVPFPFASDDHQTANARALTESGAGWMMPQSVTTPTVLGELVARLMTTRGELTKAATATRVLGRPDAARALATLVEVVAAKHAPPPLHLVHDATRKVGNGGDVA